MKYNVYHIIFSLINLCLFLVHGADYLHLITNLPGQPKVDFDQYAGHITVDDSAGRAFFYWFYLSPRANDSSLPLVLWLNGGPGCSSVGLGALMELGPFRVNQTTDGLVHNKYSWHQEANLLFLESPQNVGYSYSQRVEDNQSYSNDQTAEDNLEFLLRWFSKFPEYRNRDFYLTGESFSGYYVPLLVSQILEYNKKNEGPRINLKGFALGNPFTSAYYETGFTLQFLYSHSLISKKAYEDELESCYLTKPVNSTQCNFAMSVVSNVTRLLDPFNVYAPFCTSVGYANTQFNRLFPQKGYGKYDPCIDPITPYLNRYDVQAALHVENRPVRWQNCSNQVFYNFDANDSDGQRMLSLYRKFFEAGIRIWIYSGDFDSVVPTLSTRSWIEALNLTVEKPWHPWTFREQVAGWQEIYKELNFITFRGSGHLVPTDKPDDALFMFKRFLAGKPLPSFY